MANITNLKSDVARKIGALDLAKISGFNSLAAEAGRNVISRIDPQDTIRIAQITNAIHDDIYNYPLASDFKDIIDLRPQVSRSQRDNFRKAGSRDFDLKTALEDGTVSIRNNNGTKSIRINRNVSPSPIVLHAMNDDNDNGTWAVTGDAANLTVDSVDYVSGSASLNFDLNASGSSGGLVISNMTQVDLTDHDEKSILFVWVYIPDTAIITSWTLRWGNDASNFWSRTATAAYDGTAFRTGWNLLSFAWNGATETGTVAPATIDYLRITVAYDGTAETDLKVDNIISSLGRIYEMEYYSKYLFRNSAGTWLETPTADADTINLDNDAYNLLLYELMLILAPEIIEEDASFDVQWYSKQLFGDGQQEGLYAIYQRSFPSERLKKVNRYYRI